MGAFDIIGLLAVVCILVVALYTLSVELRKAVAEWWRNRWRG